MIMDTISLSLAQFEMIYHGVTTVSHRSTEQMLPWIIAEVLQSGAFENITMTLSPPSCRGVSIGTKVLIFQHDLLNISRFAQYEDNVFAYIVEEKHSDVLQCHVFRTDAIADVQNALQSAKSMQKGRGAASDSTLAIAVQTGNQAFEVRYLGKSTLKKEKCPPEYVDEFVSRVAARGDAASPKSMILQVMADNLSLTNLDHSEANLNFSFKDISFVVQGAREQLCFAFVSGESKNNEPNCYTCHVFRCQSQDVTIAINQSIKRAFKAAYLNRTRKLSSCRLCPLQQYHRLCLLIGNCSDRKALSVIEDHIFNLSDSDRLNIDNQVKDNLRVYITREKLELYMRFIRHLCEQKQEAHIHILDSSKTPRGSFTLFETSKPILRSLKKAKKNFALSLSQLNVKGRKRPDRLSRERSWTAEEFDILDKLPAESRPPVENHSEQSPSESQESGVVTPTSAPVISRKASESLQPPRPINKTLSAVELLIGGRRRSWSDEAVKGIDEKESVKIMEQFKAATASSTSRKMSRKSMYDVVVGTASPKVVRRRLPRSAAIDVPSPSRQRRSSWRSDILANIVTPPSQSSSLQIFASPDPTNDGKPPILSRSLSLPQNSYSFDPSMLSSPQLSGIAEEETERPRGERWRQLVDKMKLPRRTWYMVIDDVLLLIRMDKMNRELKAQQNMAEVKRQKLNYSDGWGCTEDLEFVWDSKLQLPHRDKVHLDLGKLVHLVYEGVPKAKRGDIWIMLCEQHRLREGCLLPDTDQSFEALRDSSLTSHQHLILIDLRRTFPNHEYFESQNGNVSLFNVLKAYSLFDSEVGYCQGLSFIAGIILLHMEDFEAYECLRTLMYCLGLRNQYKSDMVPLQIQLYQLSRLLYDHLPDLMEHFSDNEVTPNFFAAPWFLTIFANQFPMSFVIRVFDFIFIDGISAIFKVALAVLSVHCANLLECDCFESISEYMRGVMVEVNEDDTRRIIGLAYDYNFGGDLNKYAIEYEVLREEMRDRRSGVPPETVSLLSSLQDENRKLSQKADALEETVQKQLDQMELLKVRHAKEIDQWERKQMEWGEEKEHLMSVISNLKDELYLARADNNNTKFVFESDC